MKVDVITINEIEIGKFSWWSDWIDIAVFDYGYTGYLLQMKVSRTNRKKFNHTSFNGIGTAYASSHQAGDLTQMKANP